ncbi:hypothetical protein [Mesorhizobium sp. WSM4982]|uniref:hypothetical protein n=1 Tax=Mesorhizobium sp. WSM4982 TaxID=3038550 RepID=UPI002415805C|nr:hypothetical protein [Mesorhizobium sp. WSM4982]MDG4856436.1 hypothetical protein [Mesorhizobium sp. WSM4982]
MRDKLGQELHIGDTVAFTRKGEHVVQVGRVEMPQYPQHWQWPKDMYIKVDEGCLKVPGDVVLVRRTGTPPQTELWPGSFLP